MSGTALQKYFQFADAAARSMVLNLVVIGRDAFTMNPDLFNLRKYASACFKFT